ncbi:hypothetical protein H5410_016397 [Solanum commersonii]|uniref:Sm protein G n=1 Tax=Solanum commersonii TaxID=4109 RepID=A0A9J5ZW59_SOLCO|nr:hypothetical protein H5410_016397 [Solanum commersonii]
MSASRSQKVYGQAASNQVECQPPSCGFDQFMSLVIDNIVEVNGNDKNEIGMVVIRGNSVVTIEASSGTSCNEKSSMSLFSKKN